MILFPVSDREIINNLVKRKYPMSRLTLQNVYYKGNQYYSVHSSNLDLVAEIKNRYSINQDPDVRSM